MKIHQYVSPPVPFEIKTGKGKLLAKVNSSKIILYSSQLIEGWKTLQSPEYGIGKISRRKTIRKVRKISGPIAEESPVIISQKKHPNYYAQFLNKRCLDLLTAGSQFQGEKIPDWLQKITTSKEES